MPAPDDERHFSSVLPFSVSLARSSRNIDLNKLPPEARAALGPLDLDGNGSLDVAELSAAVQAFEVSKKAAKWWRVAALGLLLLMMMLVAALFGVSYAAAVLAATTRGTSGSASPALVNVDGTTLRTAGATVHVTFTLNVSSVDVTASGGRRLLVVDEGDAAQPPIILAHRRRVAVELSPSGGRRLVSADEAEPVQEPMPLAVTGSVPGAVATAVCKLISEGHTTAKLPFNPFDAPGVTAVEAHFKLTSLVGCDALDSFGFAVDFGVLRRTGGYEALFHIDCSPPVSADSKCTLFNVYLVREPPSPHMGELDLSRSIAIEPLPADEANDTIAPGGRRLQTRRPIGTWPPLAVSWTPSESHCPTLTYTSNFPASAYAYGTGGDLSDSASWRKAITDQLNMDPSATPAEHARIMCMSSPLCMVGMAIGSGEIFKPGFWTSSAEMVTVMGTIVANDFAKTMSLSTQRGTWRNMLNNRRATGCRSFYSWSQCLDIRGIIDTTTLEGNNNPVFTCKPWNVFDFKYGAAEIVKVCANSCEVLQWYSSWWANYRVADLQTGGNASHLFDGVKYKWRQDYCGSGSVSDLSAKYFGGWQYLRTDPDTGISTAHHDKCWSGRSIPLCRSFNILTKTNC